jgi:hypothetical protein
MKEIRNELFSDRFGGSKKEATVVAVKTTIIGSRVMT